jgi:UDP-N-acetyl-D-mannosaminuronic acid dehydrogenase
LTEIPARIRDGEAVVCIIGLGRIGLPLAVVLARSGLKVVGVDVDERRVSMISEGCMPYHYPPIADWLKEVIANASLTASRVAKESIQRSDAIIVTVGTPTGGQYQLDYSQLHAAFKEVLSADLRNKAIIVRSTAAPGTLQNIILPLLMTTTGLKPDIEFALAACPERILEGQAHRELYELPEIVGGIGDNSNAIASALFKKISSRKRILLTTPTGAELAKLFTNVYRYVNFALANEFAIWTEICGEDAKEIIEIANVDYPRSKIPMPGFAGGPCLGKDGFLLDNGTTFSSIVSVAWKLNEAVPQHVVTSLMKQLGNLYGKRIAVLGMAFKADSGDTRLSPSQKLIEILRAYGAEVLVHDPNVVGTLGITEVLRKPEIVILATNHSAFSNLARDIDKCGCKYVYDVWAMFKRDDFATAKYMRFGCAK